MKRTLVVCATVAAIMALASVANAQPQGITREMISRELPREGAPLAVPGPYEVTSGPAFASPGHVVFHPADLDAFPSEDSLPVMAWGNGGCAIDSRFTEFLATVASHGFLAVTTARVDGGPDRQTADELRAALDWAEAESRRSGSPLEGRIATDRMAVMGNSCGGFLSVTLGADPRVDTIALFNSGVSGPQVDELGAVRGPVLFANGGEVDFMYQTSADNYDAVGHVPAFYGARENAGHSATFFHPGGGEFANVASSWLRWTLKGDDEAGKMFSGADCTLCTNTNWEARSKGWE